MLLLTGQLRAENGGGEVPNYLNTKKACILYQEIFSMEYFVDKSEILEEIIPRLGTANKYLCITRPRRFGKTIMANLIASFFTEGIDSDSIFCNLNIGQSGKYRIHLNHHNVINIDFSEMPYLCESYQDYIGAIAEKLLEDLLEKYPDCGIVQEDGPWAAMEKIFSVTEEKFIFVIDEWDSMFHNPDFTRKDQGDYLQFLKQLLKSRAYVELAYMTGVLPIAKYSSGSELNMFDEYNMAVSPRYSTYFGFTEEEVRALYERYLVATKNPAITLKELREWYDGYQTAGGDRIYNPRSVVRALLDNHIGSYWTGSGPYDEIFYYINHDILEVREDIVRLTAGEEVETEFSEYAAVSMELGTKNEIYSAMVVYGFLSYQAGKVSIPNKELMLKFQEVLSKKEMGYIAKLARESGAMLEATLAGDTETMQKILSFAHDTEIPVLNYNNESDLAALVNLIYLSARNTYHMEREARAGKGFADIILYPKDFRQDCIIIELKVDTSAEHAIAQIEEKKYDLKFRGHPTGGSEYTGRILAVGLAYNKQTKDHVCAVKVLRERIR